MTIDSSTVTSSRKTSKTPMISLPILPSRRYEMPGVSIGTMKIVMPEYSPPGDVFVASIMCVATSTPEIIVF